MSFRTVFISVSLAVFLIACSKDKEESRGDAGKGASTAVEGAVLEDSPQNSNAATPRLAQSGAARRPADYICRVDCGNPGPLEAKSEREAEWLAKHRYPTTQEESYLRSAPLDLIQQEYQMGNPAAAVELGRRTALNGQFGEGLALLRNQTLSGNLYSYYSLSEISKTVPVKSVIEPAAYLRLAYLLGDVKAAEMISTMELSSVELAAADARAMHLYNGFASGQVSDPRPQE